MDAMLGFWIQGAVFEPRQLVDHPAAFNAHCALDDRVDPTSEAYLSAFSFGPEFQEHLERTGSVRGYRGRCGSRFLWFDIDRDDLQVALRHTRQLVATILDRLRSLDDDDLVVFFSGGKGFHVGLPLCWDAAPSPAFHRAARHVAEHFAGAAQVATDSGIYDSVRPFRCPNSLHAKTGLYKRRIDHGELMNLSLGGILALAAAPAAFELPVPRPSAEDITLVQKLWTEATLATAPRPRVPEGQAGTATINRMTREFICNGATVGDRHRLLFSAAANLAELGASVELAYTLLAESALDSGLSPKEVRRQIECGVAHTKGYQ
jgi:hypothetical protein